MTKVIKSWSKTRRMRVVGAAMVLLLGSAGPVLAVPNSFEALRGHSFETSRGPAYITGNIGSLQTTTLPGSGGQGLLMNNGNGTGTLLAPGALPQVVTTPR